ncbi:MAG TPA: hypothetical protein VNZ22_03910, partial [Bacillota bacterium]|nr:hypothetical protein [Bacillota bacterium]
VSEAAQAKYVPRLYLEYYLHGIKRCCHYELLDEGTNTTDNEQNRGLLRYNLTPKPAYTALRNLLTLLGDRGPTFIPGALDYTLTKVMPSGYSRSQYVRSLLFQKRDRTFWLVLYHEIASSSYTTSTGQTITGVARDLTHPDVTVNLAFNTPIAEAVVYRPNDSATAVTNYLQPQTLSVAVNDAPVVLQLKPDPPRLRAYLSAVDQQLRVAMEGQPGHLYYLEKTTDFNSWTAAGSVRLSSPTQEISTLSAPGFYRGKTQ